jgi:hypothetical protein
MLVYTPFALCFVYTSWRFYAFFGTNLLTRCHSASSYFLLFLCFRKVTWEIFSELDKTKAEVLNYLTRRQSPKESRRRTKGRPHLVVARATPRPRHQGCDRLVHLMTLLFRLFNPLDGKTLRPKLFSIKHTASHRHRRCEIRRVRKLFPAPCQRGESPPEAFFITMPASGVMCE